MDEAIIEGALKLMAREQGVERLANGEPGRALEAMRAGIYRAHHQRVSPGRRELARHRTPQEDQNDE